VIVHIERSWKRPITTNNLQKMSLIFTAKTTKTVTLLRHTKNEAETPRSPLTPPIAAETPIYSAITGIAP